MMAKWKGPWQKAHRKRWNNFHCIYHWDLETHFKITAESMLMLVIQTEQCHQEHQQFEVQDSLYWWSTVYRNSSCPKKLQLITRCVFLGLCAVPDCPLLTKAHNTEFADWVLAGAQLAPLSQFWCAPCMNCRIRCPDKCAIPWSIPNWEP